MHRVKLENGWTLTIPADNVYNIPPHPIETKIPSSVYGTLLAHGLMPDPYLRDNELDATRLMENDFIYETHFAADAALREQQRAFLRFEGIDTIADVYLDDRQLAATNNMHRVWEMDVTELLAADGDHHLKVVLHSPTKFIAKAYERDPIGGSVDAMPGFPHLRKAACMFGWDWGPRLPDAGLFRDVCLQGFTTARLGQVHVRQRHHICGRTVRGNVVDRVDLTVAMEIEWMAQTTNEKVRAVLQVTGPDGNILEAKSSPVAMGEKTTPAGDPAGTGASLRRDHVILELTVPDPQLWWPNGYGDQPLYEVKVLLLPEEDENPLDIWTRRIGLRTLTVNTDVLPDEKTDPHLLGQQPDLADGRNLLLPHANKICAVIERNVPQVPARNFAFEINGLQIFALGADYIPEDNLFTRQTRERTDMLLSSAAESNFNCLRIWGGGFYPDDYLYDLCDEKGLLVWQDLMFACAAYELSDEFVENISAEIRQNVRRLRSHACLALWCGNNENETQFETWEWPKTPKQFYDYIRMYEEIIPRIVSEEDPDAFYWPSSPSSGGNFENSMAENVGDAHYWGVWHGNEPFSAYRNHHFRFLSEFGFQSFPSLATIRRFTEPEDRNIFSRVMEMHQRNSAANGKILNYLSQTYLYPKNFDELIYCSQLLQADAIRYGVEHFRRFRGTCMGTVVWQLNDIWPVASWASLDYYGNWKALQYAEKRMFSPILLSCEEHGELDQKPFPNSLPVPVDISADLHVANETDTELEGTVRWSLRHPDSTVIREGTFDVKVLPFAGSWCPHLDFNDQDPRQAHLTYALDVGGCIVSSGSTLFCAPKHYRFADPKLTVERSGDVVTVTAEAFAKSVCVETKDGVLRLDDNYVDMEAGQRSFHVLPGRDYTDAGNTYAGDALRVRSVYEIADFDNEER